MRFIQRFLVTLLLGLCASGAAYADVWFTYMEVTCDPAEQKVSIVHIGVHNLKPQPGWHGPVKLPARAGGKQAFRISPELPYAECYMAPGVPVRLKMASGKLGPAGCLGSPPITLSIWVNQRKWMSRRSIAGMDCITTGGGITRFELNNAGVRMCHREQVVVKRESDQWYPNTDPPKWKEACEDKPAAPLSDKVDSAEFPARGRAPVPGTIVIEQGARDALCRQMVVPDVTPFGRAAWAAVPPADAETRLEDPPDQPPGSLSKHYFDIDNDGTPEVVYGLHSFNGYSIADIYFVSPGEATDRAWPRMPPDALALSRYVFPSRHTECAAGRCGPNDDRYLPIQNFTLRGKPAAYTARYLQAQPFVWKEKTYFRLETLSVSEQNIITVLKPVSDAAPEQTCVFRVIEDRL